VALKEFKKNNTDMDKTKKLTIKTTRKEKGNSH
jgi:hypothetical protein